MLKLFQNIQKYSIFILTSLFAVFILPVFSNPFSLPKEVFLVTFVILAILSLIAKVIATGSFSFKLGKFDLGVLLLMAAYLLTAILKTPNKLETFFFPATTTFVLLLGIFYFLINQLDKKDKQGVSYSLVASSILLSISVLFTEVGLWSKIPQLPSFMQGASFVPLGGNLPALVYILVVFVLSLVLTFKENDNIKKLFLGICAAVMLFAFVILGRNALPKGSQTIQIPDFQTSWSIAIETLKVSPLLGIGPDNYLSAFNLFRPVAYNQTTLWLVRFTTANDFYLTLLTETGFVGLFALVILLISIYKSFAANLTDLKKLSDLFPLLVFLLIILFLPVTQPLLILLFVLLALSSGSEGKSVNLFTNSKSTSILVSLPFIAGILALAFFGFKAFQAEYRFGKALNALTANDAQKTYSYIQLSIAGDPYVDRYHAALAQVDMALAQSIASKTSVSDADKQTITQLVQQAINEGKANVILNPQRAGNWEVLGQIYRSIMPFAQGADQFTIQTLSQAVALDPTNANLRIELGGVYYALGRYDDAIDTFKLAIVAKPDLANAYYNLAISYRDKKDYTDAETQLNTVLGLVTKDSADYKLAQSTLSDIKKNTPVTNTEGENLAAPQPVGTSNIKPPIALPSDATPPSATK